MKTKYQYQRRDLVMEQEVQITQIQPIEDQKETEIEAILTQGEYRECYYG